MKGGQKRLADELLDYDAQHPPEKPEDSEAEVRVPGWVWARWMKKAHAEARAPRGRR